MAMPPRNGLDTQQTWATFKAWILQMYDNTSLVMGNAETTIAAMDADAASVHSSRSTAQTAIEMSVGSAQSLANSATIFAQNLAGITATYATLALANAALGSIAANAFVGVLQDENYQGQGSVYQKVSSVLVYVQYLSYPRKNTNGYRAIHTYPRGSVMTHIGDSRTYKIGVWGSIYPVAWFGKRGIFEGWTSYNMGANGASLAVHAASIAAGSQIETPIDSDSTNLWRTVNANPQAIYFSLMTNDFRVGAGTATLAAVTATARTNFAACLNFLLARTSAVIILGMPPPIAFANPDPGGYTDCVNADDAAARSAAMRTLHLEWLRTYP